MTALNSTGVASDDHRISGYASLVASGQFVVTLSFLFTTPGALSPFSPVNGFLLKDILLLGAALFTSSEALRAARIRLR